MLEHFKLEERGSNASQEVRAGVTLFLTMCYILLVNPQILSKAGISPQLVVLSTAFASFISTALTGVFGCVLHLARGANIRSNRLCC